MAGGAAHWDSVYETKDRDALSWYEDEPATSLRLLRDEAGATASVIDVGAGASFLVDSLLDAGVTDVTVLDVSDQALGQVRQRLGARVESVTFLTADLLAWRPPRSYGVWHDRAVFHFLVDEADRQRYARVMREAVIPGGIAILATFALDGPTQCSGLLTARYDAASLSEIFAPDFAFVRSEREDHATPAGSVQPFTWVVLRRR
jgi:SAM-dependent methyltransferase